MSYPASLNNFPTSGVNAPLVTRYRSVYKSIIGSASAGRMNVPAACVASATSESFRKREYARSKALMRAWMSASSCCRAFSEMSVERSIRHDVPMAGNDKVI